MINIPFITAVQFLSNVRPVLCNVSLLIFFSYTEYYNNHIMIWASKVIIVLRCYEVSPSVLCSLLQYLYSMSQNPPYTTDQKCPDVFYHISHHGFSHWWTADIAVADKQNPDHVSKSLIFIFPFTCVPVRAIITSTPYILWFFIDIEKIYQSLSEVI